MSPTRDVRSRAVRLARGATLALLLCCIGCAHQVRLVSEGESRFEPLRGRWQVEGAPREPFGSGFWLVVDGPRAVAALGDERIVEATGCNVVASGGHFVTDPFSTSPGIVFVLLEGAGEREGEALALFRAQPAGSGRYEFLGTWTLVPAGLDERGDTRSLRLIGPDGETTEAVRDLRVIDFL